MSFRLHFEATQKEVDKITDAIKDVSKRPFQELFQNSNNAKDRFIVRTLNPKFAKLANELEIEPHLLNMENRTYNGIPINKYLTQLRQERKIEAARQYRVTKAEYMRMARKQKNAHNKSLPTGKNSRFYLNPKDKAEVVRKEMEQIETNLQRYKEQYHKDKEIGEFKQIIDQNNTHYGLVFSRNPIDVLRMSDHKGISSCHRLNGGDYKNCAIADAKNDGGIVYLVRGNALNKVKARLNDPEIFEDKNRDVEGIRPLGRTRLRRFVDLETGKDFAVPTILDQYGSFPKNVYDTMIKTLRKRQSIYANPPSQSYADKNIVMVGGGYSDESLSRLLNNFFGQSMYSNIRYGGTQNIDLVEWDTEVDRILEREESKIAMLPYVLENYAVNQNRGYVALRYKFKFGLDNYEDYDEYDVVSTVHAINNDPSYMNKFWGGNKEFAYILNSNRYTCTPFLERDRNIMTAYWQFEMNDPEHINSLIYNMTTLKGSKGITNATPNQRLVEIFSSIYNKSFMGIYNAIGDH